MSNYAILNFKCYNTTASIGKICDEALRLYKGKGYDYYSKAPDDDPDRMEFFHRYRNIDFNRTDTNIIVKGYKNTGTLDYTNAYKDALNSPYYTTRDSSGRLHKKPRANDNTIKAIGIVATFTNNDETRSNIHGRLQDWIDENVTYLEHIFPGSPMQLVLHKDEETYHLQGVVICSATEQSIKQMAEYELERSRAKLARKGTPENELPTEAKYNFNKVGKISAHSFIKDKYHLSQIQTDYAKAMEQFGLERGKCKFDTEYENQTSKSMGAQVKDLGATIQADPRIKIKKPPLFSPNHEQQVQMPESVFREYAKNSIYNEPKEEQQKQIDDLQQQLKVSNQEVATQLSKNDDLTSKYKKLYAVYLQQQRVIDRQQTEIKELQQEPDNLNSVIRNAKDKAINDALVKFKTKYIQSTELNQKSLMSKLNALTNDEPNKFPQRNDR